MLNRTSQIVPRTLKSVVSLDDGNPIDEPGIDILWQRAVKVQGVGGHCYSFQNQQQYVLPRRELPL